MTSSTRRSLLLAGAGAAAGLLPLRHASAQPAQFPSQPIKLIVASPPGGLMDNYARMFAEHLTARFGQPAVVAQRIWSWFVTEGDIYRHLAVTLTETLLAFAIGSVLGLLAGLWLLLSLWLGRRYRELQGTAATP